MPANRPNILLLFPDQWRFDWMTGNPDLEIRTPNLDRLVARGTRFNQAVVATPLCAPSRACLASGREYDRCGTPDNQTSYPGNIPTMYKRLRDANYHVLGAGKFDLAKASSWWGLDGKWKIHQWGFSDGINNAGKWDQLTGLRDNNGQPADPYLTFLASQNLLDVHVKDYESRRGDDYGSTFPTPLPDADYCDNWVTRNAIALLDAAPADKPWFLQVNWTGPHDPEDITRGMEKSVRRLRMPSPVGQSALAPAKNGLIRQNYTAMCENIDRGIGQIIDWVKRRGQLDNTLVIFSSDHGDMLGDLGRWGKMVPYHPSVAVPLIVAGPGVVAGKSSEALVSSVDLTSTILAYGGCPGGGVDGVPLQPVLNGTSTEHRTHVKSGLGGWRMAFDGRYKVIRGFSPSSTQNEPNLSRFDPEVIERPSLVFDLEEDPGELKNIAGFMPAQAKSLLDALQNEAYSS